METSEIYASLSTNTLTKNCIGGVIPIDQLPIKNHVKYNMHGLKFFVVNLDRSDQPGSHWVAIMISPLPTVHNEYFDSYGCEPVKELKSYLGSNFIMNTKQLQSETSTICGQWCMYYIWLRCRGHTLWDIIKHFKNKTLAWNDMFVNSLINRDFTEVNEPIHSQDFITSQISRMKKEIQH